MSTLAPEDVGAAPGPPPPGSQEPPGETAIPRETRPVEQALPPPAETPEEAEATEDAMEELRRLDDAEKFDASAAARPAPAPDRYFAPRPAPTRGYEPPRPPAGPAPLPARDWGQPGALPAAASPVMQSVIAPPRELKTLEDLNAAYPSIGDGETYLRVERKLPVSWHGQPIAGFLENVHEKLSMDDFTARYGGTSYIVDVWRHGDGQKNGDRTPRRLSPRVEIKVLGAPGMGTLPRQEQQHEEYSMQRLPGMPPQGRGGQQQLPYPYAGEPADVTIKRLEIEAERASAEASERRRLAEEARQAVRPPSEMFSSITAQAERTVNEVKDLATGHINLLREANAEHLRTIREKDAELAELRGQLQDSRRQAVEAQRYTETEQTKQLKERYETDMRRAAEEHSRAMEKAAVEHQRQIAEMTQRHVEERQRITEQEGRERDRQREDALRREQNLKDDAERRERTMRETHDARINDYERQSRREIEALKDAHARAIEAIKSTESSKSYMSEKTAEMQVTTSKDQIHRAQTELNQLRRENEDLRAKVNKPVIEAISEAHQLAKMTGLVDKDDVEVAATGDEKTDWSKVAAKGVMGLIEKLPEAVKGIAEMRQQNQAQAQHAAAAAEQQQAAARYEADARARRGLPPAQAAPRRRQGGPSMAVQRPNWGAPPAPGAAPFVPPAHMGPVHQPPSPIAVTAFSGTPPVAGGPPAIGADPVAIATSPVQPTPMPGAPGEPVPGAEAGPAPTVAQVGMPWGAPAQEPTPRETAAPPVAAPARPAVRITEKHAEEFVGRLEGAIREGLVTPKLFAQAMIGEVGPELAAELVRTVKPDDLLRALADSQGPGGQDLKMLTHEGKQYVRGVFSEAQAMLRAQGML